MQVGETEGHFSLKNKMGHSTTEWPIIEVAYDSQLLRLCVGIASLGRCAVLLLLGCTALLLLGCTALLLLGCTALLLRRAALLSRWGRGSRRALTLRNGPISCIRLVVIGSCRVVRPI